MAAIDPRIRWWPQVPKAGDPGEGVVESYELPRTREGAVLAAADGVRLRYLFFWGHTAPTGADAGPACLSQWWPAPFRAGGHLFASAEHYMMAHKAWLFGDGRAAAAILAAPDPRTAKALGREVRGFDDERWVERRYDIVVAGNRAKAAGQIRLPDRNGGAYGGGRR